MDNASNYIRMNVSLPTDLVATLKKTVPPRGISKFLAEATREKIAALEREKALKELLNAPAAFTFLKGKNAAVKWVRKLRRPDKNRLKRVWGGSI